MGARPGRALSVEAESGGPTNQTGPDWSTITYQFAPAHRWAEALGGAVGPKAAVEQPAVKFVWYDGKKDSRQNAPYELLKQAVGEARSSVPAAPEPSPTRQEKAAAAVDDPSRWDLVLVGDAGTMLFRRSATDWIITPGSRAEQFQDVPQTIRRVPNEDAEWIEACRGGPKPLSSFDYSGPFTEMVLLGNLAVRLGKKDRMGRGGAESQERPGSRRIDPPRVPTGLESAGASGRRNLIRHAMTVPRPAIRLFRGGAETTPTLPNLQRWPASLARVVSLSYISVIVRSMIH